MNAAGVLYQLIQSLLVVAAAPLLLGWVNACRAWLQNKSAPAAAKLRVLRKLVHKDACWPKTRPAVRSAPYVISGACGSPPASFGARRICLRRAAD